MRNMFQALMLSNDSYGIFKHKITGFKTRCSYLIIFLKHIKVRTFCYQMPKWVSSIGMLKRVMAYYISSFDKSGLV